MATDETGKSKGYGYVHYETGVSANMAIAKINGMLIAGKQVQSRSRSLRRKLAQTSTKRLRNIYVLGKNKQINKKLEARKKIASKSKLHHSNMLLQNAKMY